MGVINNFEEFRSISDTYTQSEVYSRALYVQADLESGDFSNTLSVKCNNIFSMGVAKSRKQDRSGTYALVGKDGKTRNFAVFQSLAKSIEDRVNYDKYFGIKPPVDNADVVRYYFDVANKGYAEEGAVRYTTALSNAYSKTFSETKESIAQGQAVLDGGKGSGWIVFLLPIVAIIAILKFLPKILRTK